MQKFLIKIWPTVYRTLNTAIYFIIFLVKEIVSRGIKQIKE